MTTFSDIFKSAFLERMTSVSLLDMALALVLSLGLGLLIFLVYKKCCTCVMYSSGFGVTLIALSMITTLLILAVTSNVVLSLGMVGALSIVRFRTAIKEPSDIAFLFWSIAVGIVLAAGMIPLAVFGSVLIGAVLLVVSQHKSHDQPYIFILHCDSSDSEKAAEACLAAHTKKYALKSKTVSPHLIELNYEVRLKTPDTDFINEIAQLSGISHTVLVSYNGDYMG